MESKIDIICGSCSKDNSVELANELNCEHCEEKITGKKYIKKPWVLIPTTVALLGGVAGGVYIDEKIETDRYPMSIEHSIIENCIHGDYELKRESLIIAKKKVCVCALEDTISEISYSEFKNEQNQFFSILGQKVEKCD